MGTRAGIELSPVACRVVELDGPAIRPGQPPATSVRSYAVLPVSGPDRDRALAALGRRPAAVVLWGVRSDHRQIVVSNGSYEKMRAEALAIARSAGIGPTRVVADISTAATAIRNADRQPVVLALASADDVSAAIQPLLAAGVRVRCVMTPADALLGLARARQAFAVPGGIEAYVALDETATCVALVRDGSLLSARELPWGFGNSGGPLVPSDATLRRDDLAGRLIDELTDFLATVGADRTAMTQVSICGGLTELRTMTVPLMERLDVEVETLDSLFGVDVNCLPQPENEFRERASELRLAWAAAADWRGPINLMRHRHRRNRRVVLARAAVVAGVAAGLGGGWVIQQSKWWQTPTPETIARAEPVTSLAAPGPARQSGTTSRLTTSDGPAASSPAGPLPASRTAPPSNGVAPGTATPAITIQEPSTRGAPAVRETTPAPAAATPSRGTLPAPANRPAPSASTPAAAATAERQSAPSPTLATADRPVASVQPPPRLASVPPQPATRSAAVAPQAAARSIAPTPAARPPAPATRPPAEIPQAAARSATAAAAPTRVPVTAAPVATSASTAGPSAAGPNVTPQPPSRSLTAPSAIGTTESSTRQPPGSATAIAPSVGQSSLSVPQAPRFAAAPQEATTAPSSRQTPAPLFPEESAASPPPPRAVVSAPPARRQESAPLPFDAVLGTILYSVDRKLAIINGRIVGPGDAVNGARIVEITSSTVLLRDPQGRLRSLTLGGRTAAAQ